MRLATMCMCSYTICYRVCEENRTVVLNDKYRYAPHAHTHIGAWCISDWSGGSGKNTGLLHQCPHPCGYRSVRDAAGGSGHTGTGWHHQTPPGRPILCILTYRTRGVGYGWCVPYTWGPQYIGPLLSVSYTVCSWGGLSLTPWNM